MGWDGVQGTLLKTPLNEFHKKAGAKMVPFCGWEMPVQYPEGVLTEHLHCRSKASIFDVSHMGQLRVYGKDRFQFMESLTVADVAGAAENKAQLSVFTNEKGGIIDDTIITRTNLDYLFVVINAGCRDKDIAHMRAHEAQFRGAGKDVKLELIEDHALVALQGTWQFGFGLWLSRSVSDGMDEQESLVARNVCGRAYGWRCGW